MFRFMHIADIHLDTHFLAKDESLRRKMRNSLRDAFKKAVDLCIEENVNALLIAGDLFDNDKLSFQTEQFLVDSCRRLEEKNIAVVYATGNHDPGDEKYRVRNIKWPSNVHLIIDEKIKIIDLTDEEENCIARIVGVGHKTNKESRNLIKNFPKKESECIYIGLAHTSVENAFDINKHDRYMPTGIKDLESKQYDYWALGHIHKRQQISELNEIHYCGNIQGRHSRENGIKGGLLVSIDDELVTVDFRQLSSIRWETIIINELTEINSYEELRIKILDDVSKYMKINECTNNNLIARIELVGRCLLKNKLEEESNIKELENDIRSELDLLEIEVKTDDLVYSVDIENYIEGKHVLARILDLIYSFDKNDEFIERLSNIEFINSDIKDNRKEYIEKIIKGIDIDVANRMVGERQ